MRSPKHEHRLAVLAQAVSITQDWLAGRATLRGLCQRHRATQYTITEAILTRISREQYRRIAREHQLEANSGGKKRLTVTVWIKHDRTRGRPKVRRQRYIKVEQGESRDKRGRWISLAQYLWAHTHGRKVPPGHIIVHLDGDAMNDDLSNLALRSRAEQARMAVRTCDGAKRAERISKTKRENGEIARRMREAMACKAVEGPHDDFWQDDEEVA